MPNGYAGRTFDTKVVTPFLQENFKRYAMSESGWLTRSLEQPHPYDLNYPGHIQNKKLKQAFLDLLDHLEKDKTLAGKLLPLFFALMIGRVGLDDLLLRKFELSGEPSIADIVRAVNAHLAHKYSVRGASRLPVLVIYGVYELLIRDVVRYSNKTLAELEAHTAADMRSKSFGDIQVLAEDKSVFEAIEIKHLKPITVGIVNAAYQKIKDWDLDRYYILTTNDPNLDNEEEVLDRIEELRQIHPTQIVVNGVLPSLKYYLRLVNQPKAFIETYTNILAEEFRMGRIKSEHLTVWNEIRQ